MFSEREAFNEICNSDWRKLTFLGKIKKDSGEKWKQETLAKFNDAESMQTGREEKKINGSRCTVDFSTWTLMKI